MNRLVGRVCIVTGSTGIAAAAATRLAAEGAHTFVVSRTAGHAQERAKRVRGVGVVVDDEHAQAALGRLHADRRAHGLAELHRRLLGAGAALPLRQVDEGDGAECLARLARGR